MLPVRAFTARQPAVQNGAAGASCSRAANPAGICAGALPLRRQQAGLVPPGLRRQPWPLMQPSQLGRPARANTPGSSGSPQNPGVGVSNEGQQPKNEAGFNLNNSVPAVTPSSLPSTSGNGAAAAAVPSDALDLPGMPHRWRIVTMMAVAFVLCNMDKVRGDARVARLVTFRRLAPISIVAGMACTAAQLAFAHA